MSLCKAVNAACKDLPAGYTINLHLENGYGGVELIGPDGKEINLNLEDLDLPDQVDEAVFAAKAAHNQRVDYGTATPCNPTCQCSDPSGVVCRPDGLFCGDCGRGIHTS